MTPEPVPVIGSSPVENDKSILDTSKPTLRLVTTTEQLASLKPSWERLTCEPMQSFAWNFAWWEHLGEVGSLQLYCLERDGQLLGIMPLYRDRWLAQNRLRFLASGKTCTDYVQLICQEEWRESFVALIAEELAASGTISVVELEGAVHGFSDHELHPALQGSHWSYQQEIEPTWVLDLPNSWDQFLKSCQKSLVRKIRKAQKRLDSTQCSIRSTREDLPLDHAMNVLVDLHQMRFVGKGEAGVFSDPNFTRFLTQAIGDLATIGQAEILVAYSGDLAIGAHLLLHSSDGPRYYQGGIHIDQMKLEPGHLLFAFAIRRAIETGARTYDFLRGNEPYKQFWGAEPKRLWKVRYVSKNIKATAINRTFLTLRRCKHALNGIRN